jgi:hypothetical protein
MDRESIIECIKSIKPKNTEGFDKISQKAIQAILDGMEAH